MYLKCSFSGVGCSEYRLHFAPGGHRGRSGERHAGEDVRHHAVQRLRHHPRVRRHPRVLDIQGREVETVRKMFVHYVAKFRTGEMLKYIFNIIF